MNAIQALALERDMIYEEAAEASPTWTIPNVIVKLVKIGANILTSNLGGLLSGILLNTMLSCNRLKTNAA